MFAKFSKRFFLAKSRYLVILCLALTSGFSLQAFRFGPFSNILIAACCYGQQIGQRFERSVSSIVAGVTKFLPTAKSVIVPARFDLTKLHATSLENKAPVHSFRSSDKR